MLREFELQDAKRTNQMAKKVAAKKPLAKSKPVAKTAKGKR